MTQNVILAAAFQEHVRPVLARAGFTGKTTRFRRVSPDVVHIFVMQKSMSSSASRCKFAINFAFASRHLLQLDSGLRHKKPAALTIHDCLWHRRLTTDLEGLSDQWWEVVDEASAQIAARSVAAALVSQGLPLMDSLSTDEAVCDFFRGERNRTPPEVSWLYVAELALKLGRTEQAEAAILELLRMRDVAPSSAWNIEDFFQRIGRAS